MASAGAVSLLRRKLMITTRLPSAAGEIHKVSEHTPGSPGAGKWILIATILGSSLFFIDSYVVSVALPVLQSDLHATAADTQWVYEAYTLLLSAFILVAGALVDAVGRRKIFMVGTIVFTLGSIGC